MRGTVRVAKNDGVLGDLVAGNLVGSVLQLSGAQLRWMRWQLSRYAPCVGRLKRWSVISLLIPKFGSYCNGTLLVTLPEKLSPLCAAVPRA